MEEIVYKYTAIGRTGSKEVLPQNGNTLVVSWEKEEERAFFSKELKGRITFSEDDFAWFYGFETSQYRCDPLQLIIEKRCDDSYSEFITARITLNSGKFNLDQCTVEFELTAENRYTCYNDGKDKEYNIIGYAPSAEVIQLVQGTIETVTCTGDLDFDQWCGEGSQAEGWVQQSFYRQTYPDSSEDDGIINVTWVREKITSVTPLSAPWISIGGDVYVKPPALYGYRTYNGPDYYGFDYQVGGSIDNGMKLKDIFSAFLNLLCNDLTIKSNFFQWNPDTISTTNYATGALSKVMNLIVFQKSDVKRPNGSGDATIGLLTFEKLIADICNIFNLKWDIDEDDNFVIEHVSFFPKEVGFNLITRYDKRKREGMLQYSYDIDNMPRKELFTSLDNKYQTGDFLGMPIVYDNSCVGLGESEDKNYNVENFMTDLSLALNNPTPDSPVVTDDGFVLVACDSTNHVLSEASVIGGNTLNNTLSWARLHLDYWRYDRVFGNFMMNGTQTTALSVKPTKKQIPLPVDLCCGEVFDPENKMLTQLGEGVVGEASFKLYDEQLTVTLLYVADYNLITNEPPVAVNDAVETFKNLTIDIDVLANDYDTDGTINPTTLAISFSGTHGVASIVDNKIRYTPNTDFFGDDIITYNVKDDWGQISNTATVNIHIKSGAPLPIAGDDTFIAIENTVLTVGNLLANDDGDGTLTCIAETKATTAGGSVTINTNGSFVYTPLTDYVGADSFTYTLKDSNDNTDEGTVNITVEERVAVYLKYTESDYVNEDIYEDCTVEGGGEGDEHTLVGTQDKMTQHIKFYSDALGLIPLDITGYGLIVIMRRTRSGDGAGTSDFNIPVSGFEYTAEVYYNMHYVGCSGSVGVDYDDAFSILSSPNYTII